MSDTASRRCTVSPVVVIVFRARVLLALLSSFAPLREATWFFPFFSQSEEVLSATQIYIYSAFDYIRCFCKAIVWLW